jgi:hypothetical protein
MIWVLKVGWISVSTTDRLAKISKATKKRWAKLRAQAKKTVA